MLLFSFAWYASKRENCNIDPVSPIVTKKYRDFCEVCHKSLPSKFWQKGDRESHYTTNDEFQTPFKWFEKGVTVLFLSFWLLWQCSFIIHNHHSCCWKLRPFWYSFPKGKFFFFFCTFTRMQISNFLRFLFSWFLIYFAPLFFFPYP